MADLSPAAQAVLDAAKAYATNAWSDATHQRFRSGVVAALRVTAQTLAYEIHCPGEGWYELVVDARDLYAIAAELEAAE